MARIRTIKPEFWTSEQIAECSVNARLLFIGLWNFCDDSGVMPSSLKGIKMKVFPGDDDVTSENIQRMLAELSANRLIVFYVVDEQEYLRVTGWHKHQKIDQPTFKYPLEDGEIPVNVRRTSADGSPPERKGKEGNGSNRGASRFTPPALEDVKKYCAERKNAVDASRFIDFYESKGWMVGKNKMKDWKACVRTWESGQPSERQYGGDAI